jgi:hypothetical protein
MDCKPLRDWVFSTLQTTWVIGVLSLVIWILPTWKHGYVLALVTMVCMCWSHTTGVVEPPRPMAWAHWRLAPRPLGPAPLTPCPTGPLHTHLSVGLFVCACLLVCYVLHVGTSSLWCGRYTRYCIHIIVNMSCRVLGWVERCATNRLGNRYMHSK